MSTTFTPTGRWLQYLVIFSAVFGIDTRNTNTYQLFALSASLLLVSLFARLLSKKPSIKAKRILPSHFVAQQYNAYSISLQCDQNTSFEAVSIVDRLSAEMPKGFSWSYHLWRKSLNDSMNGIISRETLDVTTDSQYAQLCCFPLNRGMVRFSGISVGIPDTLNLCYLTENNHSDETCLVLPKLYQLSIQIVERNALQATDQTSKKQQKSIQQESLYHLRDYRRGDALNKIHWRSVAHQGRLIVHGDETKNIQEYRHAIVADTVLESGVHLQFEESLALVHSLIAAYRKTKTQCDLCLFDDKLTVSPITSACQSLATVQPQSDFQAFASQMERISPTYQHAVLVFLNWDAKRRQLVNAMRNRGLSLTVFVVYHGYKPNDESIIPINCLAMQNELDRLC